MVKESETLGREQKKMWTQNHRTINVEEALQNHCVQPFTLNYCVHHYTIPPNAMFTAFRTLPVMVIPSLPGIVQCLTAFSLMQFSLGLSASLSCHKSRSQPLVLSPATWEKSCFTLIEGQTKTDWQCRLSISDGWTKKFAELWSIWAWW